MAICAAGVHGHPSGKIGKLVFYTLNGQPVCRLIGRAGKPTLNQMANRQGMSVTMDLLRPMADFIKVSFQLEAEGTTKNPHNLATSYNKKQALTGVYPNIQVDYTKVILSKGRLEMAKESRISKGEEGINLSWDAGIAENGAEDDILMVMVSHPAEKKASMLLNAAKRKDGSCFIPLSESKMNSQMEVYICFKSANGTLISDSAYVGNLNGLEETETERIEKKNYNTVKARYEQIAADYHHRITDHVEGKIATKAFRHLEKEYMVLKKKLEHLPGAKEGI